MKPADNLYHILGVKPDATQRDIRKAYQQLSMKHHPDRGGDNAKFAEINNAYQVLIDPERRARYDATGQTAEKDPVRIKAIDYLSRLFQKVLAEQDVDYDDIVQVMRDQIVNSIDQHKQLIAIAEAGIQKCEKTIKRTKAKEGHILYDIQNSLIMNHRTAITNHNEGIETLNMMTNLIEDVVYNTETPDQNFEHVWYGNLRFNGGGPGVGGPRAG